jgi:predicted phage baseplate assembly protein
VAEWDEVGAHEPRYRVEYEEGRIEGGNGLRGVVFPADWTLGLGYRTGGGSAGNVKRGTLSDLPETPRNTTRIASWAAEGPNLSVEQAYAASGGAPAETLAHAQARAIEAVTAPRKAVTLDDFALLARQVPGVPVGRAYALAAHHPSLPCSPAPGVVTVVVVPDCDGPRPVPGPDMLSAVAAYLSRRRLVTTDVHVVKPRYVGIVVHATLHVAADAEPATVLAHAQTALDDFFDPLTGGPAGTGWPAGRGVYRTEIMALLAAVDGVSRVTGLGLQVEGETSPRCGNVTICPTDLVASGRHRLITSIEPHARALQRSVEHECP